MLRNVCANFSAFGLIYTCEGAYLLSKVWWKPIFFPGDGVIGCLAKGELSRGEKTPPVENSADWKLFCIVFKTLGLYLRAVDACVIGGCLIILGNSGLYQKLKTFDSYLETTSMVSCTLLEHLLPALHVVKIGPKHFVARLKSIVEVRIPILLYLIQFDVHLFYFHS